MASIVICTNLDPTVNGALRKVEWLLRSVVLPLAYKTCIVLWKQLQWDAYSCTQKDDLAL